MTGITIYRHFPIINGYVQLQPNIEQYKTKRTAQDVLTANTQAVRIKLSPSTRPNTGSGFGNQESIRFEGITFEVV